MGRLDLIDVRNYRALSLEVPAGLNVVVGANAQGKSNLLEAIGILATGKSFRTAREGEVIRHGAARATIAGDAAVRAGSIRLACELVAGPRGVRKTYRLNGEPTRFARYLGSIRAVTFAPSDLALVDGPPAGRRAFLNSALAQSDPLYYRALVRYTKTLAQKGALLRMGPPVDPDLLGTYDDALVEAGATVTAERAAYARALGATAGALFARLAPGHELAVRYRANVAEGEEPLDERAARDAFARRLRERAPAELARRTPLVGPHRDELELAVDAAALAAFGSQAQKRTAVLALRLAEYRVLSERSGEAPVLLLDDVLSELDAAHQDRLLEEVAACEQVFLSTAATPRRTLAGGTWWHVDAGTVRPAC